MLGTGELMMIKLTGSEDFYPTPDKLLEKITAGFDWPLLNYFLEPSAGRGNIAEFIKKTKNEYYDKWNAKNEPDIDCIEIEADLRAILKEKEFRVVHDDFLTFHTYKHYDLIFMNPPFSQGARHLLKAIEVQEISGGMIICILNAETIKNICTNERNLLSRKLKELNAEINFYQNAFSEAENPTDVEIAVVKVNIPVTERKTTIFETLREKNYEEFEGKRENFELSETDFIASIVALYNREIEWGLRLYDEFLELQSKSLDSQTLVMLGVNKGEYSQKFTNFTVNSYVKAIRRKYWNKLFKSDIFTRKMTSNIYDHYISQINELVNYDFSYFNIKTIQIDITKNLIQGVEDCIIQLFDKLSARHSYDEDLKNNIHYYDGWKSNLSWKINKRVVLPIWSYESYRQNIKVFRSYRALSVLLDIEKALNYLDNGETEEVNLSKLLKEAETSGITSKLHAKYFDLTFYKKGTCHIHFTNERVLKKLNIFGSQKKGWLPKGYAKRKYQDMTEEEKHVIDSFEGQQSYNETLNEANYYLFDGITTMPILTGGETNGI